MSNIECRPKALVIADALKLLDTDMRSPRDGAAELLRQHAEIERLRALTQCQCGDEFTAHDPGKCGNCCAGETAALHAEIERLTAERDEAARIAGAYSPARELQRSLDQSKAAGVEARKERDAAIRERDALRAEADGLHVNMAHLLNALGVPMDGKYMGAAVEQVAQLRAELEALRAQESAHYVTVFGRLHLTDPTAAPVRQMREALLWIAGRRTGGMIQIRAQEGLAAADQWLAQQRGPLTDEEITAEASTAHGYAQGTTGSAMFRRGVRYAERAHRIGQPAGEDKPC